MRFPHYKQLDQKDCGVTCLKIIARYYGRLVDLQYLRNISGASREGVSMLGMSQAAEAVGLRTSVFEITFEQLLEKVPLPCIVHWNSNHFVVVYKVTKNKIWVSDPAFNRVSYSYTEFRDHWLDFQRKKSGVVMVLEPQPAFHKIAGINSDRPSLLHMVYSYLRNYKKELWQLGIVMLIMTILQATVPFIFRAVVDVGVNRNDIDFINIILVANITLIVSIAVANYIRDWITKNVGARLSIALLSDYLIKLMKMPVQYFEVRMMGDTLNKIGDHERIRYFILNHMVNVLFSSISFVVFSLILWFFDTSLFLIFLAGSGLYILWVVFFMRFQERLDLSTHGIHALNQSYLIETLSSITDIKANNFEQKRRWKWEGIQASLFQINQRLLTINNVQNIGSQLINAIKNVLLTFYSAKAVLDSTMTLGVMIALQFIIGFLNAPLLHFVTFIQSLATTKVSFMRMNDLHSQLDEENVVGNPAFEMPADKTITVKGLSYRYSANEPFVLKNISIIIPQGKVTAIVGKSGSGKTTLLKTLLRLYKQSEGDIFVGDINCNNIQLSTWRSHCGSVFQDGKIFNDTILNNIVLHEEEIKYDRVVSVVKTAKLNDFISKLPLGFNTRIGEKGRGLSQGQKQRILIARGALPQS